MYSELFKSIGIVGLGQIGGSLAYALRSEYRLFGFDTDYRSREFGESIGVVTCGSLQELVPECDLIFFAVPSRSFQESLPTVQSIAKDSLTVIADLCSTKKDVDEAVLNQQFDDQRLQYVGLHPLAGNERKGFGGADDQLFVRKTIAVSTGLASNARASLAVADLLVNVVGAHVLFVDPTTHDEMTNFTIDLPHVFSYLTSSFANDVHDKTLLRLLTGSSFYDVTRVSRSSAQVVGGFLYANRDEILKSLAVTFDRVIELMESLKSSDESALIAILSKFAPHEWFFNQRTSTRSVKLGDDFDFNNLARSLSSELLVIEAMTYGYEELSLSGTILSEEII